MSEPYDVEAEEERIRQMPEYQADLLNALKEALTPGNSTGPMTLEESREYFRKLTTQILDEIEEQL